MLTLCLQALEMLHNSLDSVTDESVKGEIWFEIGNHLKDTNDYKKALPVCKIKFTYMQIGYLISKK